MSSNHNLEKYFDVQSERSCINKLTRAGLRHYISQELGQEWTLSSLCFWSLGLGNSWLIIFILKIMFFFPLNTVIKSFELRTKSAFHLSDDSRHTALCVWPTTRPDWKAKTQKSKRATKSLSALANPERRRNYHQPRAGYWQRASLNISFVSDKSVLFIRITCLKVHQ